MPSAGSPVSRFVNACARRRVLGGLLALAAAVAVVPMLGLAPEPSPVPKRWELRVQPGHLRIGTVSMPGEAPANYFYFTYKVTNNSGQDLLLAPKFELATDTGELLVSGRNVPFAVVEALQARLENPLLLDQVTILGPILQGEEFAREGIVVWPAPALRLDDVTVYATGFSGETAVVTLPNDPDQQVTLRKTMRIRYQIPGTLVPDDRPIAPSAEPDWIMR